MATSLTSDFVHDFPCTSCLEDDINKEADVMCVTCNQYLCKTCLKVHNRMAGGKNHQFTDKDQFGQASTASSETGKPDLPTEICTKHHGKLIDMFCEDHDDVGCSVCMALDHRACKDMSYIPDIATGRITDKTVQNAKEDLSEHLCKVRTFRDNRHEHKSRLSREKNLAFERVKEKRKEIDEYLDKHENVIYTNISDKYEEFCENLDADITTCGDTITVLEKMNLRLLRDSDMDNVSQTFVNVKRVQRMVKEAERRRKATNVKYTFSPRIKFQTGNAIIDPETVFGRAVVGNIPPTGLLHVDNANIRAPKDKHTCDCINLCQLPSGTFIMTDWNNQKVKSLTYDTTYKLSCQLSMPDRPWGLCTVNENEVVVTMPKKQTVTFVSVGDKLAIKNSFKVTYSCTGIVHVDGQLYICGNREAVNVHNLNGKCLQTISTDQTGSALFGKTTYMCLLPEKQQPFVANKVNGIVVTDQSGKFIEQYTYPNRKWACGVCFEESGYLFIADYRSKEVVALGFDKSTTTLLTALDRKPQAVFFQRSTSRLFICFEDSDDIQVYSVVY